MREIADLGARALDDLAVGVEQQVELRGERGDVLGNSPAMRSASPRRIAVDPRRSARSGRRPKRTASAIGPISSSASSRKVAPSAYSKCAIWVSIASALRGDLHEIAALVAGVDVALDHAQGLPPGPTT